MTTEEAINVLEDGDWLKDYICYRPRTSSSDKAMEKLLDAIAIALHHLSAQQEAEKNEPFKWTFVKDHLPECEKGCEVGPVLFCTKHFVEVGYYGRGGKYRDSYFRIYTDAGEGIDSEYVIAWAWVFSLNPPKEALNV